jgi:hypothetical protein
MIKINLCAAFDIPHVLSEKDHMDGLTVKVAQLECANGTE